jgi:DNA-binding SARP family transcriptional activator
VKRAKSTNISDEIVKITVTTFGGLSLYHGNAPITIIWESQKARLLFCYLLVIYDQWIHRDKLIELLWPGCNVAAGANNFKTTVSRLRKSFTGAQSVNPVITQGEGVRINVNAFNLDASLFKAKATTGIKLLARGDLKGARQYLESAQDIYVGDFLPEEPFNSFITSNRIELADLNASVIRSLEKIYQLEGNSDGLEAIFLLKKNLVPELI